MKKVSVIMPVYNSEKYIEKALLSVLNQTLEDIEIIVIDDGSTDKSFDILNKYISKIKYKKIDNSGTGQARNVGLELATGEYIAFMDSDDYIELDMYEKLYNKAKNDNADICVCAYINEKKDNKKISYLRHMNEFGKSVIDNPNIYLYSSPYLWNKIFSKSLIEKSNIRFSNLKIFEDLEFTYRMYIEANKISKVDEPLYHYMIRKNNSLTSKYSIKFFDICKAIKTLKSFAQEKGVYDVLEEYILYTALKHIYLRCEKVVRKKQIFIKIIYINKVFKFLNKEFKNWKTHDLYFEFNKKDKKLYISKWYWIKRTIKQKNKKEF